MPRVSKEHSEARRQQILAGARRCFAANGFHAPSMQELLTEIGLSPGAFYRYFSGKEELVSTIAAEALASVTQSLVTYLNPQDPPPLRDLLGGLPGAPVETLRDPELNRLIIQVWAEGLRDEELSKVLHNGMLRLADLLAETLSVHRRRGELPADADPAACARVIIAALQGYLLQRAAFGVDEPEVFASGLRSLFPAATSADQDR
ncbi:TetR/AcrR family transcriptional regulator [Streptacidiphilus rugosus]|uniref:TetR/AcrR family transcriptional regulator n=1 Tax=Streptacidiphilus rugosus TaxID=405783 RepID=UPI00068D5B4B|nr:TetR/AcrR family transcriptional regulator [Streptacidiphilus rugosus]